MRTNRHSFISCAIPALVLLLAMSLHNALANDGGEGKAGEDFWSFRSPVRPAIPVVNPSETVSSPVDAFVLRKLRAEGLTLKAEADRRTLIRRLYFDVLGLPPSPQEVRAFVRDTDSDAYEKVVGRVLASRHYGERWGRHWLDVAGYAESSLIVGDFVRPGFWRYRDYVIASFNADKAFDEFVTEQMAGDELVDWREAETLTPEMIEKLVATGFLRCAPDGTDNQLITQEEKRFAAQQSAVEISAKALLGLTMNCVRCHDHKYDPISQQEYFGMVAIFQPAYDPENWVPGMLNTFGAGPVRAIPILDRAGRKEWARHCAEVGAEQAELLYRVDYGIENTYRDRHIREHLEDFDSSEQEALRRALRHEERKRPKEETAIVFAAAKELGITSASLREDFPELNAEINAARKRSKDQRTEFNESQPDLIWGLWDVSTEPSATPFLTRGDYRNPAHAAEPGMIRVLDAAEKPWSAPGVDPGSGTTGRRRAFAEWLTRPDHPLTARVMVNRIWQHHFGRGIVSTPDDFGERGARPSHPELLDWLAVEFVESDWSIVHMHRLILMSAAYRQESGSEGEAALLCGFPRRRLESEIIRDRMLAASGLLDLTAGGESVPTIEKDAGTYVVDPEHPGRYRRSVYLSTQRSTQPAILKVFDGPVMETNWPERSATAVAPQSLVLMNHPFVLENAAALAKRIREHPGDDAGRARYAWNLVYGRPPRAGERALISGMDPPDWETVAHALLSSSEFLYVD